jgi:hypothetical protein
MVGSSLGNYQETGFKEIGHERWSVTPHISTPTCGPEPDQSTCVQSCRDWAVFSSCGITQMPALRRAGHPDPVPTCSIRDKADQKVFHRLANDKKLQAQGKKFGVLECVAQQNRHAQRALNRMDLWLNHTLS